MKDTQQVIHDATSFLFGRIGVHYYYYTMSEFLGNFTALNTAALERLAKSDNVRNVGDFLRRRGGEVQITESVVIAAIRNHKSWKEVMALLLEHRGDEVKITEAVEKAAAENWYIVEESDDTS